MSIDPESPELRRDDSGKSCPGVYDDKNRPVRLRTTLSGIESTNIVAPNHAFVEHLSTILDGLLDSSEWDDADRTIRLTVVIPRLKYRQYIKKSIAEIFLFLYDHAVNLILRPGHCVPAQSRLSELNR